MALLCFAALTNLKKGYLFMYNLVQLLGFSWIFVNLTVRFFILGKGKYEMSSPSAEVALSALDVNRHLPLLPFLPFPMPVPGGTG